MDEHQLHSLMEHLNLEHTEPILKGWSGDKKYCAQRKDKTRLLLRLSPAEQYDAKKQEFDMMGQVAALAVPMCRPLAFGMYDEWVYSLQSWIAGKDAEEIIPSLPRAEQYAYGRSAGNILRLIHTIPAPSSQTPWAERFNRKMDWKIAKYQACEIHYDGGEHLLQYIEANRHLLDGRPQSFQHGDYHIGNMMVDESGRLQIIDFNRFDFGDPWEEFNRIVWCAQASPPFASGMVDGYFHGNPPMAFWRLLALYIASNTLSSVYWAIPFGDKEVQTMLQQAGDVLDWYDNMNRVIPRWYTAMA